MVSFKSTWNLPFSRVKRSQTRPPLSLKCLSKQSLIFPRSSNLKRLKTSGFKTSFSIVFQDNINSNQKYKLRMWAQGKIKMIYWVCWKLGECKKYSEPLFDFYNNVMIRIDYSIDLTSKKIQDYSIFPVNNDKVFLTTVTY